MTLIETKHRNNYLTLTTCPQADCAMGALLHHLSQWHPGFEASYSRSNGKLVLTASCSSHTQDGYVRAVVVAFYYGYTADRDCPECGMDI